MKILLGVVALLILAGCASSPVPTRLATPVAANRVFAPAAMRTPCADCGTLIVKRDAHTIMDAGVSEKFFVNKTPIATLWPSEKVRVYLTPGYYVLSAWMTPNYSVATAAVEIKTGQTRIYRLSVTSGGDLVIQPAAQ
jgi:hypothetical protein